ncbi:Hypothetical predicted protein [Olea europaea subsp. europaea]|uniref:Uncharacterized protein n=1 Tax=Olea europaea subsp. europaea TaxID=158383 RepID=A0A8S0RD31_OLEEU|nr:Hypothetical predicted protein [Olea europaea subsp. europaea]
MISPESLSRRNSMHRTLAVEMVDNWQGRVWTMELPVEEVVRMRCLEMTMKTGSQAVIATVMISRILSRAHVIDPTMVRIPAKDRWHMASECKKLREFLATLMASAGRTTALVTTPIDTEAEVSS